MEDLAAEALTVALLAASRAVVDGISAGVRARGFTDVRPAHGFAFARLARGDATITQLADHLDITRQAAAQLADELVAKGYIERRDHPDDGRAKLLVLTSKGWACTRAAEAAIAETVASWESVLGAGKLRVLRADLEQLAARGPLRPLW
ncbi:MAG TPA: MarR family winged helix-turn-helix transcriptional regulator [Streptosporangiaceae bacterium]|jgi:DNA-binding MarR family transcriptional regulator|nr:MarR family winged helix-turn-helix transcriptional regulator [Streptosporangiaceae bacterium]